MPTLTIDGMPVEVPEGSPVDPEGWLGVDLGIRNLATDSDGEHHSGAKVVVRRFVVGPRCGAVAQQVHSDDLPAFITQQVYPAVGHPCEL